MHKSACRFVVAALLFVSILAASAQAPAANDQQQFANLGACKLISGHAIADCRLGYRTWGTLNPQRTNAVLFATWFNGTSASLQDSVGPDRLADPTKYFVIAVDALGDGVSSSPSNSATQHGPDFPQFTMQDQVNAEYRLATETLHLHHLHAVMGISMGGQQTFEWMVDYPDFMDLAIPIVGSPRPSTRDLLVYCSTVNAIKSDPAWQQGRYRQSPPVAGADLIFQITLTTPANYARTHPAAKFAADFDEHATKGILPTDANDWLAQIDAIIHLDVGHGGSLEDAAKRVKAKVCFICTGSIS